VAQREAEGLHGRSAHAHTVVTLGDGQGGSARSHEMIRPRPSGVTASAPPLLLGQPPPPPADSLRPTDGGLPRFLQPGASQLVFNEPAIRHLAANAPSGSIPATTLHFTFGSAVMMDFVKNWLHFAGRAGLSPLLVGTADSGLLDFCNSQTVPAAAISPELDVWTYKRKERAKQAVYEIKSEWKYFRHHNSDFLEMGLVKVAFLWELLSVGYSVLISDLDVVWLNGHWPRWMMYGHPSEAPLPEASLIAAADVLVTTDELNAELDISGRRPGAGTDLNTGVVYFRAGPGARAMVQSWRKAMLRRKGDQNLNENVNDQSLFNQIVHGVELRTADAIAFLEAAGHPERREYVDLPTTRRVARSQPQPPCLPDVECEPVSFTYGTLPMRPFSGGHTWFNQNVGTMQGHELPQNEPVTVHFTFQFGDTGAYPHGKRQRAREAALWAVDPPEYFTEGVFVALKGPAYTLEDEKAVYSRFPEWSPQRHMQLDAPQRRAVRDLLGLATAVGGITVLPKLWCHCDRYWGFLRKCRFPNVPKMHLPFSCPQDALYDPTRWAAKKVRWREHTFLDNPNVPEALKANTVTLRVAERHGASQANTSAKGTARLPNEVVVPYGTRMSEVMPLVQASYPNVRVIQVANDDLRRLCRWLGSAPANANFNKLMRYILTESSRYCPQEDMGGYGSPGFNWQNPFTAYNCTWGFHYPTPFPTSEEACDARGEKAAAAVAAEAAAGSGSRVPWSTAPLPQVDDIGEPLPSADGIQMAERPNSTTCPRIMLCDYNVREDGSITKSIKWCNIEGYNGMKPEYVPLANMMLAGMPNGRCPYPPGDQQGMPGFDRWGHWVG